MILISNFLAEENPRAKITSQLGLQSLVWSGLGQPAGNVKQTELLTELSPPDVTTVRGGCSCLVPAKARGKTTIFTEKITSFSFSANCSLEFINSPKPNVGKEGFLAVQSEKV